MTDAAIPFIIWGFLFALWIFKYHRRIGSLLFGRRSSPLAQLSFHSEPVVIYPAPEKDEVLRSIQGWRIANSPFPEWPSLFSYNIEYSDSPTVEEIESLFRPISPRPLPYEIIDHPPEFPTKNVMPEEPKPLPEKYPEPILSLPFYNPRFSFLNFFVRIAHQELIQKKKDLDNKIAESINSAKELNAARMQAWEKMHKTYVAAKDRYCKKRDEEIGRFKTAVETCKIGYPEGVEQFFDLVLRGFELPSFVPREWKIKYEPETRILLLEHKFPETARLEVRKLVQQVRGQVIKPAAQTVRKLLVSKIQPALCLQLARGIVEADDFGVLDAVAVNGWVDFFHRATGQPSRAYCASLVAKKAALLAVRLETADPVAAFNALSGCNAGESYEISPVLPSLSLQKDDPRFIASKEVTEKLARGENLAAMDWEDFEHLVRELFEREFAANGGEVKITRASRDQGVDAIIFDPDPIRGGKIVVQAKRYTIPVGVSAVRDLYGTVVNEGANTGILVTTSHYGSDAYEFAQNKPLKLFNGAQLLGLLERAGYRFRIDLEEARELARQE